jgi:hypothetical protein
VTDEALEKGLDLQKQIKAAIDLMGIISEPTCELMFCPKEEHYENASRFPEELASLIRPVVVEALKAKAASLAAEFASL